MTISKSTYRPALAAMAVLIALAVPGFAQYQPEPAATPAPQSAPAYAPAPTLPQNLMLPAGAVITVRVAQTLSSDRDRPGDQFQAVLDQPVVANGWVVARRGQTVLGQVVAAQKASHSNQETSQLGIELTSLTLVDGQQVPLRTQLLQSSGGGIPGGQEVATVAAPTGIGAVIGGAAAGGAGAGIGAIAGATAGMIGVALTHGRPTIIPVEAELAFQQEDPISISTAQSAQAFQPVSQQDYAYAGAVQYGPAYGRGYGPGPAPAGAPLPGYGYAPAAPYPAYSYYYGYPYYWGYPYSYGYPAFGFGLGLGFGYGPGFYGGFGYGGYGRGGFGGRGGFRR